jgi:hypothetical protein
MPVRAATYWRIYERHLGSVLCFGATAERNALLTRASSSLIHQCTHKADREGRTAQARKPSLDATLPVV